VGASRSALSAYVPRLVRQWLIESTASSHQVLDATLVFVDISGFTRLSERLARRGRIGAEELTDAIGSCFSALLGVAYEGGATLLKFGGDALLLLFTGDDHAARACRSAVGMRRELVEAGRIDSSAGRIRLRMSIGMHSGSVHLFLVGGSHRELVVTGPAATETVAMEATASAGEIVISGATATRIPAAFVGASRGGGYLLRGPPPTRPAPVEPGTAWLEADALGCVPPLLREHALATDAEPEHRRVTTAFLRFGGVDTHLDQDGPAAAARSLDALVRSVQGAADAHAVTFLGTDIDAGGGKIILISGAPASSGDDEERMLLALRRIVADPARLPRRLPLRIGVNVGHVFAGDIGPSYRRAYTVMGDAVNLAARVMGRAEPGSIVATPEVVASSRTPFVTAPLEPFLVKGKTAPVIASLVGPVDEHGPAATLDDLPFVGRTGELAAFDAVLDDALTTGAGRAIDVVGEAGIGKSRLLTAFRDRAEGRFDTHLVAGELHRAATPYACARRLLRDLLEIDQQATPRQAGDRLLARLRAELPEMVPWAPLVAIAVGGQLPPTEETATLDDQYRRTRLHTLVAELLAWRWPGPVLLLLEDLQWMDDPSAELFGSLVARLEDHPWIVVTSRRPADVPAPGPGTSTVLVKLAPLDRVAAAALTDAATQATPFGTHQTDVLIERSGGNPLFLQELIAAAVERGGVEHLPDSVESLVTARIDRLPRRERTVLRHVSVLGRRFPIDLAVAVLPDDIAGDDGVWDGLGDFLVAEEGGLAFRHALVRDVAYAGLRYRLRRTLHATAGEVIAEVAARAGTPEPAALLSFHYLHAQRHREAWQHALAAAEQAAAVYADAQVAESLERAIEAAKALDDLAPEDLARVHEWLGDVRDHMGAYREAAAAYRTARRTLPADDVVGGARLMRKLAREHGWLDRFPQARRWLRRGLTMLADDDAPAVVAQRAELAVWYAHFCEEEGRHGLALRWCRRAIAEAESVADLAVLAHAHRVLGRIFGSLGDPAAGTHWMRALQLYEQLGDLDGQGAMINNLGALAYWEGRWSEAREHLTRSLEICRRVGDEDGVATAQKNLGQLLVEQGRLDEAARLIGAALQIWRAAGHRASVGRAQRELAWVAARSGRHDEAVALLASAHAAFQGVGAEVDDIDTLAVSAESYLLQRRPEAALRILDDAIAQDAALGGVSAQSPLLHRLRGYALSGTGDAAQARLAFATSLEAAEARAMHYEVALTSRALADLAEAAPAVAAEVDAEALRARSQATLERLDVVWVPDIPGVDAVAPPVDDDGSAAAGQHGRVSGS
jgi:class 3 adenylate cyclase/tetratricopeptide (TPR) repeat protein